MLSSRKIRVAVIAVVLLCGHSAFAVYAEPPANPAFKIEQLGAPNDTSIPQFNLPQSRLPQANLPQANLPQSNPPQSNDIRISGLGNGSAPWTIVVLLTFLTLIPSLVMCMTPFARLLIVFHFLRQALGLQTTPSNQTLIGLAMVLTFFIMQPVGEVLYKDSVQPLEKGKITGMQALERVAPPMKKFMAHYVREKDVALFVDLAKESRPHNPDDLSLRVLAPAYVLSELKAGFQIGAVLFLPFLVIDMVVASITTSVGMLQLPPVVISTPLKIMLFVMVDGWNLLVGSLIRSFS